MIKRTLCSLLIALLVWTACACARQEEAAAVPLSKTIYAAEDTVQFLVPENWRAEENDDTEALVLKMTDGYTAYAHVYYYCFDEEFVALDDFLPEYTDYFGDDVLGDVEDMSIGEQRALKFEYQYDDINEYFESARFHGFIYLVDAPLGVICIDIYHTAVDPPETDQVSTEQQRLLLQQIAESLTISDGTAGGDPDALPEDETPGDDTAAGEPQDATDAGQP